MESVVRFTVGTAPKITEKMTDVIVVAPDEAAFACGVNRGDPDAEVTW